jgi:hypothetical protein
MKGNGDRRPHHNGPCSGKIAYLRRDIAEFEAQRLADQLNHRTSVYHCAQCGDYHVGKNENGPWVPGTPPKPEAEGEREQLVLRRFGIEAALDELKYGQAVDRGWEKRRRLLSEKHAIDLRLAQIKLLRKEAHNVRIREAVSRRRAEEDRNDGLAAGRSV